MAAAVRPWTPAKDLGRPVVGRIYPFLLSLPACLQLQLFPCYLVTLLLLQFLPTMLQASSLLTVACLHYL